MLHGIGRQASNFKDVMTHLDTSLPAHMLAVNLPGYGGSAPYKGALSFAKYLNFWEISSNHLPTACSSRWPFYRRYDCPCPLPRASRTGEKPDDGA